MQFLYAVEKKGKLDLAALGLDKIVRGPIATRGTGEGPGGSGSWTLFGSDNAADLFYRPNLQTWRRSICGGFWIGCFMDQRKPTPADLARENQLDGHFVKLVGGNEWLIPVARSFVGVLSLPGSLSLGPEGQVVSETLPEYIELSRATERLWHDFQVEQFWIDGEIEVDVGDRLKIAIDFVGLNYHVGIDDLNLLGVISTDNLSKILCAILDVPAWKKYEADKKKETVA